MYLKLVQSVICEIERAHSMVCEIELVIQYLNPGSQMLIKFNLFKGDEGLLSEAVTLAFQPPFSYTQV